MLFCDAGRALPTGSSASWVTPGVGLIFSRKASKRIISGRLSNTVELPQRILGLHEEHSPPSVR